jgi:nucleotide-binding universal stress UspA family protein
VTGARTTQRGAVKGAAAAMAHDPLSFGGVADQAYVVVAAVAFDETGAAALGEAARVTESSQARCELHAVHVVHEGAHATTKGEMSSLNQHINEATAALQRVLHKQATQARVICHVRVGNIAQAIVQAAIDINADLLIVGSHQRAGVAQLLLGSVAKEVVAHAHCAVLVAIPKDYSGLTVSQSIEPACSDCLTIRRHTKNQTFWCTRHQHAYHKPHLYVPSESGRPASVMPAGH